jgi:DNA mismatch repair protein MutS
MHTIKNEQINRAPIKGAKTFDGGSFMAKYTPMIEQYLSIKAQYKDAFLFFRLGDFYEMFFEDAIEASKQLEITLTSRDGGSEERIPMCGVPYHSAENYINRLVENGNKVAICEQTEDPKQAKGVVRREVVQLITPGTIMNSKVIDEKENNYIAAITEGADQSYGIAYIDLTTGECKTTIVNGTWEDAASEIYSISAKEVILPSTIDENKKKYLSDLTGVTISTEDETSIPPGYEAIVEFIDKESSRKAIAKIVQYITRTQNRSLQHIQPAAYYETEQFLNIDIHSKRNLELVETIRSKGRKGSLLWLLDKTVTAMGGRLLKQWIERPLLDRSDIEKRQKFVELLLQNFFEREELREQLKEVYDLERLAGKISFGTVNARDLLQLKKSLEKIPEIKDVLERLADRNVNTIIERLDPCNDLVELLSKGLKENPSLSIKDGDIIKDGYDPLLDKYRDASRNGKQWIAELEKKERKETSVKSLKVGYNKVFGYYIEVTRPNLHLLAEGRYERKQTLTNAERFITPELKEKEALILEAEEKIAQLEYELFIQMRENAKAYIPTLQQLAKVISECDVLQCFATISEQYHYTKPSFSDSRNLAIKQGRHPVVEKVMNAQQFVANDCYMDDSREILLITGPNMSGKSTYMRQIALTAVLAQIGCFVPAEEAVLPIFDQIFTRIGAADDLVSGQSTFMVEMMEAKHAVTKATDRSLILLDEIGRGTSTYDGMALAQAIIEYIHDHIGSKTLFSTHYHELTDLENHLLSLKNVHVRAVEENGKVVFLHKIEEGFADKSYGIHVAELAELPALLINRAREILNTLENIEEGSRKAPASAHELEQLSFFVNEKSKPKKAEKALSSPEKKAVDRLNDLNLLEITPLEAMNLLYELQKMVKS